MENKLMLTNRAWAEVDLDAIGFNIRAIRSSVKSTTKIMGVVKADAYGHGCLEVAKALIENGADSLGVAFIDEAEQLRKNGFTVPILILGHTPMPDLERVIKADVSATVYSLDIASELSMYAIKNNKKARLHIKIDTGMSRLGFLHNDSQTINDIRAIYSLPGVEVEGIFSHLACADEQDEAYSIMQFERFMELVNKLEKLNINIPIKHISNSAATLRFPQMQLDLVRPGIIIYGLYPSSIIENLGVRLKPAMTLKAGVTRVERLAAGTRVSYGGIYTATSDILAATVPIGYADGYSRLLSGRSRIIAAGEYAPVIGRICMDQCIIDVSFDNNIKVDDEVVVFGKCGDKEIPVEELAELMGTINYEVLCVIGKRVPRAYIRGGKVVEVLNYLL